MGVFPEGTKAELEAKGADLEHTPSCSRHEKGRNMGCEFWTKCIFASPNCGHLWEGTGQFMPFRDNGPRNVGYEVRLSDADGGAQKQDYCPCNVFMSNFYNRAKAEDTTGEHIRVVAVEGQTIVYSERVPEEPNSKTGNMKLVEKINPKFKVPPFRRAADQFQSKYQEAIAKSKAVVSE